MLQEYGKSSQEFEAYPIHYEMEIFKSIPIVHCGGVAIKSKDTD